MNRKRILMLQGRYSRVSPPGQAHILPGTLGYVSGYALSWADICALCWSHWRSLS